MGIAAQADGAGPGDPALAADGPHDRVLRGPDVGLLVASGQARRVVTGFVVARLDPAGAELPAGPPGRHGRARPRLDEGMLHWGLLAAAHRLPFLPIRAGLGSGVLEVNPSCARSARRTTDGEELVAMPALRLDAALVHMNRADAAGNGQYLGPDPYFDDLFCLAARAGVRLVRADRAAMPVTGPPQTLLLNRAMVHGVIADAERRPLHQLRPRLRPRRGVPEALRGGRGRPGRVAAVHADVPRKRRGRLPEGGPVTRPRASRAEVCVVACAEAWRGDGAILASPMGLIPTLGARLARLTFAPDLLLTDGEAYLVDEDGQVRGLAAVREGVHDARGRAAGT